MPFLDELNEAIENKQPVHKVLQKYPIETMELFIEPKQGKRLKFNLAQKKFVDVLFNQKKDIYALGSRQIAGKSTIARFSVLYALLAYPGITIYYVTLQYKGQGADFINRLLQMVDYLPPGLKLEYKRVAQDNSMIKFSNGSVLIVAGAQHASDYADLFKSHSVHILIIDEFPNIKRNKDLLAAATPTLTATRKVTTDKPVSVILIGNAIEITSDSHRYAYKLWIDSIEGKTSYVPVLFYYRDLIDETEADKIIQEELIRTQSKRHILVNYECHFLVGEHAFLDDELVKNIQPINEVERLEGNIKLWKPFTDLIHRPIIFGVDIATLYGTDYYAIVGIDAETLDYLVEWNDKISALEVVDIIVKLSQYFPNSIFVIERNMGAHIIELVANQIEPNRLYKDNKGRFGFYTTQQSKSQIFKTMKQIMYKKPDIIVSKDLFSQLLVLEVGARKIEVNANLGHDDLIMAFGIALQAWYDIVNGLNTNAYSINFDAQNVIDLSKFIELVNSVDIEAIKREIKEKTDFTYQTAKKLYGDNYMSTDPISMFEQLFLNK